MVQRMATGKWTLPIRGDSLPLPPDSCLICFSWDQLSPHTHACLWLTPLVPVCPHLPSPVLPVLPALTCFHLPSPALTCPHVPSPVLTCPHLSSRALTVLPALTSPHLPHLPRSDPAVPICSYLSLSAFTCPQGSSPGPTLWRSPWLDRVQLASLHCFNPDKAR